MLKSFIIHHIRIKLVVLFAFIALIRLDRAAKQVTLEGKEKNLKTLSITTSLISGSNYRLRISGSGRIESSINTATITPSYSSITEIEIDGDATGISCSAAKSDTALFTAYPNVQKISIYNNVNLEYQTFYNMKKLEQLYIESSYTVDIGRSSFYQCEKLTTVIIKANIILQCWTFGGCPLLSKVYYYGDKNPGYNQICGNPMPTFNTAESYLNNLIIYFPYGSSVNDFANAKTSNFRYTANAKISGNIVYLFEGSKLKITGNGTVYKADLAKLNEDKIACGCSSNSDFTTVEFESTGGKIVVESTSDSAIFSTFTNLITVNIHGNVELRHWTFYNMQTLKNLLIETNETVTLLEGCFQLATGLSNVVMYGSIRAACWVFQDCSSLKTVYYCGASNPVFQAIGYSGCTSTSWNIFTGSASSCQVKVPYRSSVTKFGEKSVSKNGNQLTKGTHKIITEKNKLFVTGSGDIDNSTSNAIVSGFLNKGGCFSCKSYDEIKTVEFKSDGSGTLATPYYLGPGSSNTVAYLGFLTSLETAIFGDNVEVNHHIFYGMPSLKTVIINSSTTTTLLKDCFTSSHALTYHIQSDIKVSEHVFLNCKEFIQDIYLCGNVEYAYTSSAAVRSVFTTSTGPSTYITYYPRVHIPSDSSLQSFDIFNSSMLMRDANTFSIDNINFTFFENSLRVVGSGNISRDYLTNISYSMRCISCNSYENIDKIDFDADSFIERGSFSGIKSLTSLTFNKVRVIGERSFSNCNLQTVFMSRHVIQIEDYAFSDNSNLALVSYCGQSDPGVGHSNQFEGCPSNLNISVPKNDLDFAGYSSDTFCSRPVNHLFGHEFCGIETYHFTYSVDFSPSTIFSNSKRFVQTQPFIPSNIFSFTKHFTISDNFRESNQFTNSKEFSGSLDFSVTNCFRKTNAFSDSHIFKETDLFAKSKQFSSTELFSNSAKLTKSMIFTATSLFNPSNNFAESNKFSLTNEMTMSQYFKATAKPSQSIIFSQSNKFSRSSIFTLSSKFSPSSIFTPSLFVNQTAHFSPSSTFSFSNHFTKSLTFSFSNHFTKSSTFSFSNHFSKSSTFSFSNHFSKSNEFTRSIQFSPSSHFTSSNSFKILSNSNTFTNSKEFLETSKFTKSNYFSLSSKFSQSSQFTKSNEFTKAIITSDVPKNDDDIFEEPLIEGNNGKGLVIGVSVGIIIFIVLLVVLIIFFLFFKKKSNESQDYGDELETETYNTEDETTEFESSLFDIPTTQDNPIWTSTNQTEDTEHSFNFDYEETSLII